MTSMKLLAGLLLSFTLVIAVKSSCPDAEDIDPCTCKDEIGQSILRCKNVPVISVLEKVAKNSDGFRYDEVHIEDSTLQYIPKIVQEKIRTRYLFFKNMTLNRFVDDIPNTLDELKSIVLRKIVTLSGLSWEVFKNTKGLESLTVDQVPIPIIKEEFNTYVSHNLKTLYLHNTNTKEIRKGAFDGFGSLQTLSLMNNNLQDLKRDVFPVPFNVELLFLHNNKLSEIPEDFFTAMPNLRAAFFTGNLISRFNEPTPGSKFPAAIDVIDNPIKCDCYLKWIVTQDARNIQGTCEAPKKLKGKSFQDLTERDFDC